MAIAIKSDLVLDVIRSVTPHKKLVAQAKLGGVNNTFTTMFDKLLGNKSVAKTKVRDLPNDLVAEVANAVDHNKYAAAAQKLGSDDTQMAMADVSSARSATKIPHSISKQDQQFEAMMLRNFVEEMMPKQTASLYGEGTAGEIWRSMQVDYMSQEMAKSGGIGIASLLSSSHNASGDSVSSNSINRIQPNFAAWKLSAPNVELNSSAIPLASDEQAS